MAYSIELEGRTIFLAAKAETAVGDYIVYEWNDGIFIPEDDEDWEYEDDEEEEGTTIAKTDAEKIEEKPEEKGTETDAGDELSQAKAIIAGLGGSENIVSVDCCFTRLRVELKDVSAIDEKALKKTGCSGVVKKSNEVQVVYGMQVGEIKNAVESAL